MTGNTYDQVRAADAMIAAVRARHPMLIDLTTGRVERLLEKLGRPQDRLAPVVHIAGTNGKGSTAAYLRAIGEAAGLRVHMLTSPHLVRFAERIMLAGRLIEDEALVALIERVEAINAGDPISFFELTTVAAILAFAETPADLVVVEVGLGGRHDATNIFERPAMTVITPVDYDHVELLGPTLTDIAREKAGILRKGTPCVAARQHEEAFAVIEAEAQKVGAPLIACGRDFDVWEERGRLLVQTLDRLLDLPAPGMAGVHQFDNAGVAAAAALGLGDRRIEEGAIGRGVEAARWPARMQRLTAGPLGERARRSGAGLWLDGGHNAHAGEALARTMARLIGRDPRPLVLIVGMLQRKDPKAFLAPFTSLSPRVIGVGFSATDALSADAVAGAAASVGLSAQAAGNLEEAMDEALGKGSPAPHVLICGSLHLAGDVLALSPETWPS